MTRKKQYKKHLPAVLPPAPRTRSGSEGVAAPAAAGPAPEAPAAAPALPSPRAPEPEWRPVTEPAAEPAIEPAPEPAPEPAREPAPASTAPTTTAEFVRQMRQRAGDEPEHQQHEVPEVVREDDERQPEQEAHDRSRRLLRVLAMAGVLVAGVAAGALAYWWTAHDDGTPAAEGAWTAPAALEAGEGHVETRVHADGTMEVRQWVHADEPLERLTLRVPRVSSAGQLAADSVEVLADGERVSGREEISYFNATYDLGGATRVEVRYRLVGALQRSDSATGRALAVATGLEARFSPAPAREVRVVKAPEVLSLACTPAADTSPVPCGGPEGQGEWHVELTGRRVAERVVASLTVQ